MTSAKLDGTNRVCAWGAGLLSGPVGLEILNAIALSVFVSRSEGLWPGPAGWVALWVISSIVGFLGNERAWGQVEEAIEKGNRRRGER